MHLDNIVICRILVGLSEDEEPLKNWSSWLETMSRNFWREGSHYCRITRIVDTVRFQLESKVRRRKNKAGSEKNTPKVWVLSRESKARSEKKTVKVQVRSRSCNPRFGGVRPKLGARRKL